MSYMSTRNKHVRKPTWKDSNGNALHWNRRPTVFQRVCARDRDMTKTQFRRLMDQHRDIVSYSGGEKNSVEIVGQRSQREVMLFCGYHI